MQRAGHVEAGVVAVGALEANVLRRGVGADQLQEGAQRHSAPLADRAPALDADQLRDLAGLRQPAQLLQAPGALVADPPGNLQAVFRQVDLRHVVGRVERVEGERRGHLRRIEGRRQPRTAEQPAWTRSFQRDMAQSTLSTESPSCSRHPESIARAPRDRPPRNSRRRCKSTICRSLDGSTAIFARFFSGPFILRSSVRAATRVR